MQHVRLGFYNVPWIRASADRKSILRRRKKPQAIKEDMRYVASE